MEEIEKRYFKIREVAEEFNMSVSLVRTYEKIFKIRVPRTGKGQQRIRYYTPSLMEKFRYIRELIVVEGYRYDGAVRKFREKYPKKLK